jgi:hypothetical protein
MSNIFQTLAVGFLLMFLVGAAANGAEPESARIQVNIQSGEGAHAGIPLTVDLKPGDDLPEGTYQAKVRVSLTTEKISEVSDSRKMEFQPDSEDDKFADGWLKKNGAWIWKTGTKTVPLSLSFKPALNVGNPSVNLSDFDELWFDFAEIIPGEPIRVNVSLDATVRDDNKGKAADSMTRLQFVSDSQRTFSQVSSVDAVRADWKPKDSLYLVKRELGLGFDADWRYIQDQKNVVIQRRFHQSLENISAMDILLLPGIDPECLNLLIRLKENSSPIMIDWNVIPKEIKEIPGGRRLRLYLDDVIQQRLALEKLDGPAFLAEMVMFFPGDATQFLARRPLRSVNFLSSRDNSGEKSSGEIHSLPQRVERMAQNWHRLVVDLRPLAKKRWREIQLLQAKLSLNPPSPLNFSGLKPLSLRLVSLAQGKRPVYYRAEVLPHIDNLGGPFLTLSNQDNTLEWIEIDAKLPLERLTAKPQKLTPWSREMAFPDAGITVRQDPSDRKLASREDVEFAWIETEDEGLVVEGEQAQTISLQWTLPRIRLEAQSHVTLGACQGAEHIRKATLDMIFQDGEKETLPFTLNRAMVIGNPQTIGRTIQNLTFRLEMDKGPFRLKLTNLQLFHPFVVPAADANQTPWPYGETSPLKAENILQPEQSLAAINGSIVHGVRLAGYHPTGVLSWWTPIHLPAQSVNALLIRYRLGAAAISPDWLTLTLVGEKKRISFSLSPKESEGQITALLAKYLRDFQPGEQLQSIFWQVQLPPGQDKPASFQFQADLDAKQRSSLATLLQRNVLVRVDQSPLHALTLTDETLSDLSKYNSAWINMESFHWAGGVLPLELPEHPYYKITRVRLESSSVSTDAFWDRMMAKDPPGKSPWPGRLLLLVAMMGAGGVSWLFRRRLSDFFHRGLNGLRVWAGFCLTGIRNLLLWVWRLILRFKVSINRSIGILTLVPGCWLLGRMGDTPLSPHLLAALGIVICGVLRYEMRWQYASFMKLPAWIDGWTGNSEKTSFFITAMSVAAFGGITWSLGKGQFLGAVLITVAISYTYLIWLPDVFHWMQSPSGRCGFWCFFTLGLYVRGVFQGPGTGENYWFTFGGMAAVLSWRYLLISLQAWVKGKFPVVMNKVYGGAGTVYFSGALVGLVFTALLLMPKLEALAEQVAVIVYYFLVVGTVLEVLALRRESRKIPETSQGVY